MLLFACLNAGSAFWDRILLGVDLRLKLYGFASTYPKPFERTWGADEFGR
jgi:hypothetical protein